MSVNVVIVEDDFIIQMFLEETMIKLGYNVIGLADNSEDCIRLTEQFSPDIILMDINIDGKINGIDTAQIIYEKYKIPLVFLTGNRSQLTKEVIEKTNPICIIKKPVDENQLIMVFNSICEKIEAKKKN
jgi:AmiR/NasT family two-component response regulator